MAILLSGKAVRDKIALELQAHIKAYTIPPVLLIVQVGDREDSNAYIKQKKLFAKTIGATIIHKLYPESVTQQTLVDEIKKYNTDVSIHGILVQMPVPAHLDKRTLLETVNPAKDVDGLTSTNTALLYSNEASGLIPATARGICLLLDHYGIEVAGKKVTIVGRSYLVGRPTALALLNKNASVTIVHRHSEDVPALCRQADIVIVAIGKPEFITPDYVKPGQVVIDVGINADKDAAGNKKLVGDVDFKNVEPKVFAISPVPGGVGPMTVAALFSNLVQAYTLQRKR